MYRHDRAESGRETCETHGESVVGDGARTVACAPMWLRHGAGRLGMVVSTVADRQREDQLQEGLVSSD